VPSPVKGTARRRATAKQKGGASETTGPKVIFKRGKGTPPRRREKKSKGPNVFFSKTKPRGENLPDEKRRWFWKKKRSSWGERHTSDKTPKTCSPAAQSGPEAKIPSCRGRKGWGAPKQQGRETCNEKCAKTRPGEAGQGLNAIANGETSGRCEKNGPKGGEWAVEQKNNNHQ